MKEYTCIDEDLGGGVTVIAPENSCLFCKHCTDVFWDFIHGPYLTLCDKDKDVEKGAEGKCDNFEESEE